MVYPDDDHVRRERPEAGSRDSATNSSPSPSLPPQQHAHTTLVGPLDRMEELYHSSAASRSSRSSHVRDPSSANLLRQSQRLQLRPSPFRDTDLHMAHSASVGPENHVEEQRESHRSSRNSGSSKARVWSSVAQHLEEQVIQPCPSPFLKTGLDMSNNASVDLETRAEDESNSHGTSRSSRLGVARALSREVQPPEAYRNQSRSSRFLATDMRTAHPVPDAPEDGVEAQIHPSGLSYSGGSNQLQATSSVVLHREPHGRQSPETFQPASSAADGFQGDAVHLSRVGCRAYHELSINVRVPFTTATADLKQRSLALYDFLLELQGRFKLSASAMLLAHPLIQSDGELNLEPDKTLPEGVSIHMSSIALLESLWTNIIGAMEMAVPSVDETDYEQLAVDLEYAVLVFRQANTNDTASHIHPEEIVQSRLATGVEKIKAALDEIEPVMEALIDTYGSLIGILTDLLELHTTCAKLESLWCSPVIDDSHEWDI
nr:hypothetical protein CFP56_09698 [Quercus suber]